MTDYKQLCAELLDELKNAIRVIHREDGTRHIRSADPVITKADIALAQPAQPEGGTSHISIVDADGRVLAMTTTIEAVWGARILADGGTGLPGGYLLNNELTDFSFAPADAQGRPSPTACSRASARARA